MTNLEVAQSIRLRPIIEVAAEAGLHEADFEPLGHHKAKLTWSGVNRLKAGGKRAKLVLVTAITPTPKGEGKTTVTIGLAQGLSRLGTSISATREPALGPIFGVKGGACGGGYSQVLPMEDINMFFTGDFPAIAAAHNLLSAMLDAHIHNGNALGIDTRVLKWPRTVDMNDRALREIVTGMGGRPNGPVREGTFVITPASEVMAVLCLSRNLQDLKERVGRMIVGLRQDGSAVFAREIGAAGAMTALLRDALRPNLVQTVEGKLALVHGGPFGNIAHGCSSILATECALGLGDFVVTEAGFGSDLGGEKFMNIVAPELGFGPDVIVLVATVRALAHHGGGSLADGLENLWRHVAHMSHYGPPVVIALNRFESDSDQDLNLIVESAAKRNVKAVVSNPYAQGGEGCILLAEVVNDASSDRSWQPLVKRDASVPEKITTLVQKAHGGKAIELSAQAQKDLNWLEANGFGHLPICVAKTQYSLSDNPALLNAPTNFDLHVQSLRVAAGAGFIVAQCGDVMLMPGLGKSPAALSIDVDADGGITGLF